MHGKRVNQELHHEKLGRTCKCGVRLKRNRTLKIASLTITSVGLSRRVRTRTKFALRLAGTGFLIGVGLCAYTFYVTSSRYKGPPPSAALYLVLCPFSFASVALDNAGVAGGLVGWFSISIMNAALYDVIGFGIGDWAERRQR
jgi:hypothetical protein